MARPPSLNTSLRPEDNKTCGSRTLCTGESGRKPDRGIRPLVTMRSGCGRRGSIRRGWPENVRRHLGAGSGTPRHRSLASL
ncbi:hypothetical protein JTE90_019158 [Oedothorax gibbosus]|uniref:Uncharacterized protein n=1 Tax=Oedothorax gibbosus TaxID=931172 RepID=A0AAV6UUU3_9ARAC|nr:hypothetical protein JTE90_019158 [Oedothorax gibbosus]